MDNKFLNVNSIIKYIRKNKLYFAGALVAVALLLVAFFTGGKINYEPKTSSNIPVSVSATADEALLYSDKISTKPVSTSANENDDNKKRENKENSGLNLSATSASAAQGSKSSQNSDVDYSIANTQTDHSGKNDNTVSKSQTSSSISPYSKEYYYRNNSETLNNENSQPINSESLSDNSSNKKDKYDTDPVPSGKPQPVEPQEQEIEENKLTCTISISCATILDNLDKFNPEKIELIPDDGWILRPTKVTFNEGESVYDLLVRVCKENEIHMTARWTPIYNSHYIESINNIKEFDCPTDRFHNTSGWMYCVNDWYPNYGVSRYELQKGDIVEFNYTCVGLGRDLGAENWIGG